MDFSKREGFDLQMTSVFLETMRELDEAYASYKK